MSKFIDVKNVSFSYRTGDEETVRYVKALEDLSLSVNKGEFVAVIGHNGSGKSTLAKLLNGIILPHGGEVIIDGMKTSNEEEIWSIRQKAGMIFQNPDNQMVATIVEEDVAFGPENLGVAPTEIRKRVDESLKEVGMYDYMDKKPHELSGGQKQRIAIAGILAMEPECIILDEPTAMLDPEGRKDVLSTIRKLSKEKDTTILLITHYMEEITECDKVFVLDGGKLVMSGTPREIFSDVEKLHSLQLEPPYATQIAYAIQKEGLDINTSVLTLDELVDNICQLK